MKQPDDSPKALSTALLDRLKKYYPVDAALLGAEGAQAFVVHGIGRALAHGIEWTDEIYRYLDLMIMFGIGFDEDPLLPWVARHLDEKPSMPKLWAASLEYGRMTSGAKGERYIRALLQAKALSASMLVTLQWTESRQAHSLLSQIHPEKVHSLGGDRLDPAFSLAQRRTRAYDPKAVGVRPLYLVLMFLLGSHFDRDPRYAWAREPLNDTKASALARYERLHQAALANLTRALGLLRQTTAPVEGRA